jgi:hypothetical protein
MVEIAHLSGLWLRSLIVRPDGAPDTTSWVGWLQGPSLFIDLRVPAGRPSFGGVRCLRDITATQAAWLASQEGFAGRLERDGGYFVWQRLMDFRPKATVVDSGLLRLENGVMIEEGRYVPYVEHWDLVPGPRSPLAAARLREIASGRDGFLIRAGASFMYARAGDSAFLPAGTELRRWVEAAGSLEAKRELIACEISYGSASPNGWVIERSSLPYREGARLDPAISRGMTHGCRTADVGEDGRATVREWEIVEIEGDMTALNVPAALRA